MLYEMVDRHAALPGREHGAAGAHDPLADRAAAGARPLPRALAAHPDQSDGARSGVPLPIRARVRAPTWTAFRAGAPVAAVTEDLDATRRTFTPARRRRRMKRAAPPGHPCRRMRRGSRDPRRHRRAAASAPRASARVFGNMMRVVAVLALASFLYGVWVLTSDYLLYEHGQQLAREIESEQLTDLDQIWTKMDGTFQGQSLVFVIARTTQSGEAEVRRGGRPRDRQLPQQRIAGDLRKGVGARPHHGGAALGGGSRRYHTRQAAPAAKAIWRASTGPAIAARRN